MVRKKVLDFTIFMNIPTYTAYYLYQKAYQQIVQ